ncbi:hypothetical protein MKY98_14295 [Paenibacillus sp. FSL M8-0228]|uniref:hypothetical protein n=1 Tax=Paenibacillus TaxID=44249 RepID=UPI00083CBCBB|nr:MULTISPECIES: hypothetical protein [Paenibacillus]MBO3286893.1 hypothetical protein [Paenibacillus polymyxa]MBP1307326.1 putative PurR-regulated permease PerM [Paenibacillus sp. 1182]ODB57199.1 hypothetical protein A7311_14925 [Paenibacillus polymyxa]
MFKKYTDYSSTREYLKERFELKRKWLRFQKTFTLEKLEVVKTTLKKEHSLIELGTIKSDIKSELDQHKSLASSIPMITIVITILVSTLSNNTTLNTSLDNQLNTLRMKFMDIVTEQYPHQDKVNTFGEYTLKKINDLSASYFFGHIYSWILYFLALCMIILLAYYYVRTRFLSSLENIVAQSYEEKEREEKEAKDHQKRQEQLDKKLKQKQLEDRKANYNKKRIQLPDNFKNIARYLTKN